MDVLYSYQNWKHQLAKIFLFLHTWCLILSIAVYIEPAGVFWYIQVASSVAPSFFNWLQRVVATR